MTPEEYRSRLLMPKSWTTTKHMNTATNQPGRTCWPTNAVNGSAPFHRLVPLLSTPMNENSEAPRTMIAISGSAVPRNIHPTTERPDTFDGRYLE